MPKSFQFLSISFNYMTSSVQPRKLFLVRRRSFPRDAHLIHSTQETFTVPWQMLPVLPWSPARVLWHRGKHRKAIRKTLWHCACDTGWGRGYFVYRFLVFGSFLSDLQQRTSHMDIASTSSDMAWLWTLGIHSCEFLGIGWVITIDYIKCRAMQVIPCDCPLPICW